MVFGKLFSKLVEVAKEYIDDEKMNEQPPRTVQSASWSSEPVVKREKTSAEWENYFRDILRSEFPAFNIRENVPVTDLAGFASDEFQLYKSRPCQVYKAEWGQPYTFVLESAGNVVGVVMLGKGHSHDSNVKYLIARMYAKKLGVPYINFYTQMPNERAYVIGRIRKMMN